MPAMNLRANSANSNLPELGTISSIRCPVDFSRGRGTFCPRAYRREVASMQVALGFVPELVHVEERRWREHFERFEPAVDAVLVEAMHIDC